MTAPSAADRLEGWRRFRRSAWARYGLILLIPAAFLAVGMAGVVSLTRAERLRAVMEETGRLIREGKFAEAEAPAREALRLAEARLDPGSAHLAVYLSVVAQIEAELGRLEEADARYRRALAIVEAIGGAESPMLQPSLNRLGAVARADGRHADAEAWFRRSVDIADRKAGRDFPETLVSLHGLAGALIAQRKPAEAELFLKRAALSLKDEHPNSPGFLDVLADLYDRIDGKAAEAKQLRDRGRLIRLKREP
jgi:tetratricopeptide (TPR) repeat protein